MAWAVLGAIFFAVVISTTGVLALALDHNKDNTVCMHQLNRTFPATTALAVALVLQSYNSYSLIFIEHFAKYISGWPSHAS